MLLVIILPIVFLSCNQNSNAIDFEEQLYRRKIIEFGSAEALVKKSWDNFEQMKSIPDDLGLAKAYICALNDLNSAIKALENEVYSFCIRGNKIGKRKVLDSKYWLKKRQWYLATKYGLTDAVDKGIFSAELAKKLQDLITGE